jgi:hypothetical protein
MSDQDQPAITALEDAGDGVAADVAADPTADTAADPTADTAADPTADATAMTRITDAATAEPGTDAATAAGPRTRWAGIIWGVALASVGIVALQVLLGSDSRAGIIRWALHLSPLMLVSCALLVVGGALLVTGVVGIAHRLQHAATRSRRPTT